MKHILTACLAATCLSAALASPVFAQARTPAQIAAILLQKTNEELQSVCAQGTPATAACMDQNFARISAEYASQLRTLQQNRPIVSAGETFANGNATSNLPPAVEGTGGYLTPATPGNLPPAVEGTGGYLTPATPSNLPPAVEGTGGYFTPATPGNLPPAVEGTGGYFIPPADTKTNLPTRDDPTIDGGAKLPRTGAGITGDTYNRPPDGITTAPTAGASYNVIGR